MDLCQPPSSTNDTAMGAHPSLDLLALAIAMREASLTPQTAHTEILGSLGGNRRPKAMTSNVCTQSEVPIRSSGPNRRERSRSYAFAKHPKNKASLSSSLVRMIPRASKVDLFHSWRNSIGSSKVEFQMKVHQSEIPYNISHLLPAHSIPGDENAEKSKFSSSSAPSLSRFSHILDEEMEMMSTPGWWHLPATSRSRIINESLSTS